MRDAEAGIWDFLHAKQMLSYTLPAEAGGEAAEAGGEERWEKEEERKLVLPISCWVYSPFEVSGWQHLLMDMIMVNSMLFCFEASYWIKS